MTMPRSAVTRERRASVPRTLTFLVLCVPQPHSRSPTIGIDEFHACGLEHAPYGLIIDAGELGFAGGELGAADGGDADFGLVGELLGRSSG